MDKGKQFFISTVIILLSLLLVSAVANAGEFDVTYRKAAATPNVCAASYDVLVKDERSTYKANAILKDYFQQHIINNMHNYNSKANKRSSEYKKAYKKLRRGSWNTNVVQLSYCMTFNL